MENNHRLQYYLGDCHRPNYLDHPTSHQRCFSLRSWHFFFGSGCKKFSRTKAELRIKKKMMGEEARRALPSPLAPSTIVSFFCSRFSFRTAESFTFQITEGKTQPKKRQLRRLEVFLHDFQGRLRQSRQSR